MNNPIIKRGIHNFQLLKYYVQRQKNKINLLILNLRKQQNESFECPICGYNGPFLDEDVSSGLRKNAICPNCNALERHRIQFLVINDVLRTLNTADLRMLHFAPEPFFHELFSKRFGRYETADLNMKDVDHNVDLQQLPFKNETYDFVFASHVLEHIRDDEKAITEIRRILRPNGVAILPVPIVAETTIEYPKPIPSEFYHVRAPGIDYYERYERHFSRVERFYSDSYPDKYQLYIYEDRSQWPTKECPLRLPMQGEKHIDIIPVCYV